MPRTVAIGAQDFGRIIEKDGKAMIKAMNYNKQADEGIQNIYESLFVSPSTYYQTLSFRGLQNILMNIIL